MDIQQNSLRRFDLDWLRIFAFGTLIIYHVGMYYVPWQWHLKSTITYPWLMPAMALVNPWRLTLLFLISGVATRFALEKSGAWRFTFARTFRLIVPLVFGMFVIVPPQTWLQVGDLDAGHLPDFLEFYYHYVTSSGGWQVDGTPLSTPTWNHLWFVAYLLTYTVAVGSLCTLVPVLPAGITKVLELITKGFGIVVFPLVVLTLIHIVLLPVFPETHGMTNDWSVHSESFFALIFGFGIAKSPKIWTSLMIKRRQFALAALLSAIIYTGVFVLNLAGQLVDDLTVTIMRWAYPFEQWLSVAAILGYGCRYLSEADHPARRYLTQAIFPFYIVHQSIILAVAWWLRPYTLPVWHEAGLIILATLLGCFGTFELVRRLGILKPLFGIAGQK